jgi:hypothetical protein
VPGLPRQPRDEGVDLPPADPEAKGLVERLHDYLERSFLPGRTFTGPADFNAQLAAWLSLVNTRSRRALGSAPTARIAADLERMLPLPPVAPATGGRVSTRLARDNYVRLDGNDYSVHPAVIGRRVEVVADLHRVRALCDGRRVADHAPAGEVEIRPLSDYDTATQRSSRSKGICPTGRWDTMKALSSR